MNFKNIIYSSLCFMPTLCMATTSLHISLKRENKNIVFENIVSSVNQEKKIKSDDIELVVKILTQDKNKVEFLLLISENEKVLSNSVIDAKWEEPATLTLENEDSSETKCIEIIVLAKKIKNSQTI